MQHRSDTRGVGPFFLLTLGLTWLAWVPAALSQSEPNIALFAVGGSSPSLWGAALTLRYEGRSGLLELLRRSFDPRLIAARWWLPLLLLYPLLMALGLLAASLLGKPAALAPRPPLHELPLLLAVLVVAGPLSEELGWSGFALDHLQSRWSALSSSLILSVVGILWHLPLFLMDGTAQGEMGLGSLLFAAWVVRHVASKVLRTWVYNNTGSVLSTIVLHFTGNFTFTMIAGLGGAIALEVEGIDALLQLGVAALVLSWWGPALLVRSRGTVGPTSGSR
jgi:membrane protease YdiL (CAAX protease family)